MIVRTTVLSLLLLLPTSSCGSTPLDDPTRTDAGPRWQELFDGRSLGAFVPTAFGGEGAVTLHDGAMQFDMGSPLSGVTLTDGTPVGEYELEVVAARLLGNDFFCAVTFPVGDDHLTLVLGGWGGTVCGLSNLDGMDASANHTRTLRSFELERDYRVRIRVDRDHVQTFVDGEPFVSTPRRGVRIGLRSEMLPCIPLGVSAYATTARVRSVRWRPLPGSG